MISWDTEGERALRRFQKWFDAKRRAQHISQERLARELGVSQQAVSAMLSTGDISFKNLVVMLDKVNATDEEVLKYVRIWR